MQPQPVASDQDIDEDEDYLPAPVSKRAAASKARKVTNAAAKTEAAAVEQAAPLTAAGKDHRSKVSLINFSNLPCFDLQF